MCLSSREHWMCLSKTGKREAAHKGPPAAEEGLPVLACRSCRHAWPVRVGDGECPRLLRRHPTRWERKWERVLLRSALRRFGALACAPPDLRRPTSTEDVTS